MSTDPGLLALQVTIEHPDVRDQEELEALALQLREDLLEAAVERVDPARAGEAPPGTRAVDALAVGGLIVTITKAAGPLLSVVKALQSWLSRNQDRNIHIVLQGGRDGERAELDAKGLTAAEQRLLVDAFLKRMQSDG
jgi:ornithine cyclodeaminase/alanine dehydrogenase-like protein (mu-crystallin family)